MNPKKVANLYCIILVSTLSKTPHLFSGGTISRLLPSRSSLSQEFITNAERGNEEHVATILTHHNSIVNTQDPDDGMTALMWASYENHTRIVERLIAARAEVEIKSDAGWTALMLAAGKGHITIVDKLIARHTQVNNKNVSGFTALTEATTNNHPEVVKSLIAAQANVNSQMYNGSTALIIAARSGAIEIVKLLLDAGADTTIHNNTKNTALECAQEKGHTPIVELLQLYASMEKEEETLMVKPACS